MKYLAISAAGYLLLALVTVKPVGAQQCATPVYSGTYRPAVSYRSYSAPVYHAPTYVAPTYVAPTYVEPTVVKKVIKEEIAYLKFVAVVPLVELPTYSAQFVSPYAPIQTGVPAGVPVSAAPQPVQAQSVQAAPVTAAGGELKQILDMLKGMDSRLKVLEGKGTSPTAVPTSPVPASPVPPGAQASTTPQVPDVKQVNQAKCAICHAKSNAEQFGRKFVLSEDDGTLVRLSNEQLGELDEQLSTNAMPKINARAKEHKITPLNDAEYAAFRQEISRQRALNKEKK